MKKLLIVTKEFTEITGIAVELIQQGYSYEYDSSYSTTEYAITLEVETENEYNNVLSVFKEANVHLL